MWLDHHQTLLVTLGDNCWDYGIPLYHGVGGFGEGAQGRVRWCNEVGHKDKGIKQNERWRWTQIQWPGIDGRTLRTLTQPPGARMKNAGCLKWSRFTDKQPNSLGYRNTQKQSSAPTVCSEWNQWVPKGSGVDFHVNSLCLKVKWGKREAYGREHSRGEENRAKLNGGESFREKEVSFLTLNALWSPLTKKTEKQGSAIQREYAWHGEHCSGNNKMVESLSPQAPCMAHLDLMAGVLSLLLFLQYFLSEWTPPNLSLLSSNL